MPDFDPQDDLDDDIPPRQPFWRCEECGHQDHIKPMPTDRAKFYARTESPKCPKCKSVGFVPVGF
jgi:hypothetical protein